MRYFLSTVLAIFICTAASFVLQRAYAQDNVDALSDLVGAKAGQAENTVKQRGYTWVKTEKQGGSSYSYWTESGSNKCVTIRTADGRYQSFVYSPDMDCQNDSTAKTAAKSNNAQSGDTVSALSDLVGAKAGQAENTVKQRGYTWVQTSQQGGSAYSYWTESGSNRCVTIRTSDARYQSIIYTPDTDCEKSSSTKAAVAPAKTQKHCKLYNNKSDNYKYEGGCKITKYKTAGQKVIDIAFVNGESYQFVEQDGGKYKVQTPEGWSDHKATMNETSNKTIFDWYKWELTFK